MNLIFNTEVDKQTEVALLKATEVTLAHESIPKDDVEISVSFVDCDEIRSLNANYRDTDSVTDVLSFPQYDAIEDIEENDRITLGDVVICTDQIGKQAIEYGHTMERELVYLYVHSLLHLLFYDHQNEDEKRRMRESEKSIMEELNV